MNLIHRLIENKENLKTHLAQTNNPWVGNYSISLWHEVASTSDIEAARLLVEYGVPINIFNYQDYSALGACKDVAIARFMLDHGADIETRDQNRTMLHKQVVYARDDTLLRFYLSRGANVTQTFFGLTLFSDDEYDDDEDSSDRKQLLSNVSCVKRICTLLVIQLCVDIPGACPAMGNIRGFPFSRLLKDYL